MRCSSSWMSTRSMLWGSRGLRMERSSGAAPSPRSSSVTPTRRPSSRSAPMRSSRRASAYCAAPLIPSTRARSSPSSSRIPYVGRRRTRCLRLIPASAKPRTDATISVKDAKARFVRAPWSSRNDSSSSASRERSKKRRLVHDPSPGAAQTLRKGAARSASSTRKSCSETGSSMGESGIGGRDVVRDGEGARRPCPPSA